MSLYTLFVVLFLISEILATASVPALSPRLQWLPLGLAFFAAALLWGGHVIGTGPVLVR